VGYFWYFSKKLPKANNRPKVENSSNLFTLSGTHDEMKRKCVNKYVCAYVLDSGPMFSSLKKKRQIRSYLCVYVHILWWQCKYFTQKYLSFSAIRLHYNFFSHTLSEDANKRLWNSLQTVSLQCIKFGTTQAGIVCEQTRHYTSSREPNRRNINRNCHRPFF
jgi:hypothetical protein